MAELDSNSTEKAKNKEAAQNAKSKSILESFEYIVELAEDSNLGKDLRQGRQTYPLCCPQASSFTHADGSSRHVCRPQ